MSRNPSARLEKLRWPVKITVSGDYPVYLFQALFSESKKIKFYRKIAKAGVIKKMITISITLETMRQLIIKLWRSLGPWCSKKDKFKKIQKKLQEFLKIADIKVLKNIPLHVEATQ